MSRRLTAAAAGPLTNLAHLDFLTATVTPPLQPGHTTYLLDSEPSVGVLWVHAYHLAPGSYQVTGGGTYDPADNSEADTEGSARSTCPAPAARSLGATTIKDANRASRSARTRPSPCQYPPADSPSCCARSRPANRP